MRLWCCSPGVASVVAALWAISGASAAEFRRLDGVHRVEKKAEITQAALLLPRDEDEDLAACGTSMKLCPSSVDGGCCPDEYECAKESCYATTRGPSTCGTRVGWYACAPVYGGGCCPDGYRCQTADQCVPPSGVSYTFDCPTGRFLCPASLNYGCCPDGMGCAENRCYSTESETITTEMVITTTEDGDARTYTTETTAVQEPEEPTDLPEINANEDTDQQVIKYFPSSIPKVTQVSSSDDDDGGGGLSTGQLAGIITGAVAFLVLVIVAAVIIIRHLNKVVAAVGDSRQSGSSSHTRPTMKQFKPTDSEVDALSVDPLMMSPRPVNRRKVSSPEVASSTDETPSSFAGAYQPVSAIDSRHASWDSAGQGSYFDPRPGRNRFSVRSGGPGTSQHRVSADSQGTYMHVRHWSNASEDSNDAAATAGTPPAPNAMVNELEANSVIPELPGSPTTVGSPTEDQRRRSSGGSSISGVMTRPPVTHQRMRSGTARGNDLGVVSEEIHGFHGPPDKMVGQTDVPRPPIGTADRTDEQRPSSRGSWRQGDDGTR